MKKLLFVAIAILSLQACTKEEEDPKPPQLKYQILFQAEDNSVFDISVDYGKNKIETNFNMKSNEGFDVYLNKGDAIHLRLVQSPKKMKVLIGPKGETPVTYSLVMNETLIVTY